MRKWLVTIFLCLTWLACGAEARHRKPTPTPKPTPIPSKTPTKAPTQPPTPTPHLGVVSLIEWGWDEKYADALTFTTVSSMEANSPFDGIVFAIPPLSRFAPFAGRGLVSANQNEITAAQAAPFVRFSHNFNDLAIAGRNNITPSDKTTCMWRDDVCWDDWEINAWLVATSSFQAGYEGLVLDTEAYNGTVWDAGLGTYDEVFARGAQLGGAIESGFPGAPLILTYAWSLSGWYQGWPMLPAFLDGLMSTTTGSLIDGNEGSYDRKTAAQFAADRQTTIDAKKYSHYPTQYAQRVKIGFGIWMESTRGTSDQFRVAICEAMKHADKYVWLYSEAQGWWIGTMPSAYVKAATDGRSLYLNGASCG